MIVRQETTEDAEAIYNINNEAFGQKAEAELVKALRDRSALMISLVAIDGNGVVGHIAFSAVRVESVTPSFKAMVLAPMAVLPAYQRRGIGLQLVQAGLEECRRLGYDAVVLVGHPDYYPRFGFVPARAKGLECEFDVSDEAWMVLELRQGALRGKRGKVRFQPEFSGKP
ncbi:MAG: hypothetical protein A2144_14065 [Chloroflexi bacterium RBG_16_50_9]|nr:MAG: hypothetical protein A2144_14065 [Chloroflexi bacterium RBG_16_50_9]